jgi:regulatory protein SWI6
LFSAITTLLTETEAEFSREMNKKQAAVDELHAQLRDASRELGEQRQILEQIQAETNEREARKLKTTNFTRAYAEERTKLAQMQAQYGQMSSDVDLQLGEADTGLTVPEEARKVLSNLNINPNQPLIMERAQRQLLSTVLPPAHVLRARLNAYKSNNQAIEESVRDLQSKSSELASKYRKVIGLCTGVGEQDVDRHLENLLRAVESEHTDVELTRVRDFLTRVESV